MGANFLPSSANDPSPSLNSTSKGAKQRLTTILSGNFQNLYPARLQDWTGVERESGEEQCDTGFLDRYSYLESARTRFQATARESSTIFVDYRQPKKGVTDPQQPTDFDAFTDRWEYVGSAWKKQRRRVGENATIPNSILRAST
jgi:hypothetical protein